MEKFKSAVYERLSTLGESSAGLPIMSEAHRLDPIYNKENGQLTGYNEGELLEKVLYEYDDVTQERQVIDITSYTKEGEESFNLKTPAPASISGEAFMLGREITEQGSPVFRQGSEDIKTKIDIKSLLGKLAEKGKRLKIYRTFAGKEFEAEQWESTISITPYGNRVIMDTEGAILELLRQPANDKNHLPEGYYLSISLKLKDGKYMVKGVFAGKGIYPLYGSMGKKRARNFIELPLDTVEIDPADGSFKAVKPKIVEDFWYEYNKAYIYDVDQSTLSLLVPGQLGIQSGWGNDNNKRGLFYLQKMVRIPNDRNVDSYVGVTAAKFKIRAKENETIPMALKALIAKRSRISAEMDLKKQLAEKGEIQSLYYISKIKREGKQELCQIELPITYKEDEKGRRKAALGTHFFVSRFNRDGSTDPSWGAKYELRSEALSHFPLWDKGVNPNDIEVIKQFIPESLTGEEVVVGGNMELQWEVEPVKDRQYILPFPKKTKEVTFNSQDIGDPLKNETIELVNFYNPDGSRNSNPYALRINRNIEANKYVRDVLQDLNVLRAKLSMPADSIFNLNATSTTYDMIYTLARFYGMEKDPQKMVEVLFNASQIKNIFESFIGELSMNPGVVNAILEWTVNLTVEKEKETGLVSLDLKNVTVSSIENYGQNKKELDAFAAKLRKLGETALSEFLRTFLPEEGYELKNMPDEKRKLILREYFSIDTPEGAASVGELAHWAAVKRSLRNAKEKFDFDDFLNKFKYVAGAESYRLMAAFLKADNPRWEEKRDQAKMAAYLKKVSKLASYDIQSNLDDGEILGIIKGETARKEGKSYETAQKITQKSLIKAKLDEFSKKIWVPGGILGVFIMLMMWLRRSSKAIKRLDEPRYPDKEVRAGGPETVSRESGPAPAKNISEKLTLDEIKGKVFKLGHGFNADVWEASVKIDPYWHQMTINVPLEKLARSNREDLIEALNVLKDKNKKFSRVLRNIDIVTEKNLDLCIGKLKDGFGEYVIYIKSIPPRHAKDFSFKASFLAKYAEGSLYRSLLKEMGDISISDGVDKRFTARQWKFSRRKVDTPYDKFAPNKWAALWPHTGFSRFFGVIIMASGLYILMRSVLAQGVFTWGISAVIVAAILAGIYPHRNFVKDALEHRITNFISSAMRGSRQEKVVKGLIEKLEDKVSELDDLFNKLEEEDLLTKEQIDKIFRFDVEAPMTDIRYSQTAEKMNLDMRDYLRHCIAWLEVIRDNPGKYTLLARGHYPWYDQQFYAPTLYVKSGEFTRLESDTGIVTLAPGSFDDYKRLGYRPGEGLLSVEDKTLLPALEKIITKDGQDPVIRINAAKTLALKGNEKGIETLISYLQKDPDLVLDAIVEIADDIDIAEYERLIQNIKDFMVKTSNEEIKNRIIYVLGELKEKDAASQLLDVMRDDKEIEKTRKNAADALIQIRGKGYIRALLYNGKYDILANEDKKEITRVLLDILMDGHVSEINTVERSFDMIKNEISKEDLRYEEILENYNKTKSKDLAIRFIGYLKNKDAADIIGPDLIKVIEKEDFTRAGLIIAALGEMGTGVKYIKDALTKSDNNQVRISAIRALGKMKSSSAGEVLISLVGRVEITDEEFPFFIESLVETGEIPYAVNLVLTNDNTEENPPVLQNIAEKIEKLGDLNSLDPDFKRLVISGLLYTGNICDLDVSVLSDPEIVKFISKIIIDHMWDDTLVSRAKTNAVKTLGILASNLSREELESIEDLNLEDLVKSMEDGTSAILSSKNEKEEEDKVPLITACVNTLFAIGYFRKNPFLGIGIRPLRWKPIREAWFRVIEDLNVNKYEADGTAWRCFPESVEMRVMTIAMQEKKISQKQKDEVYSYR